MLRKIVYLNIIVAFSTGVLSAGFCRFQALDNWLFYGLFAFFSTLAVYNGQRIYKSGTIHHTPWLDWVHVNRKLLTLLVVVSAIIASTFLVLLIRLNLYSILILGASTLISLLYIVRIGNRNLRELPYIKIHLIALSWTAILICFPLINEGKTEHLLVYGTAHYIYVLAVTIPFDIRDLKYDKPVQRTIPQVLGVNWARVLSALLLVAFSLIMFYAEVDLWYSTLFYLAIAVQLAFSLGMNENQSDVYCAGGIDGAIALLGVSYLLL